MYLASNLDQFPKQWNKNTSNLITDRINLKKLVQKVASIEDLPKFMLSFLSILLEKVLRVIKQNRAAGVQPSLLNTRSIHYSRHFFVHFLLRL